MVLVGGSLRNVGRTASSRVLFIWTLQSFHSFNGKNCNSKHVKSSSFGSKIMQLLLCLVNPGRNKVLTFLRFFFIRACFSHYQILFSFSFVSLKQWNEFQVRKSWFQVVLGIIDAHGLGEKCFNWWVGLRLIDNYSSFTQCHLFSGISLLTLKGEEPKKQTNNTNMLLPDLTL